MKDVRLFTIFFLQLSYSIGIYKINNWKNIFNDLSAVKPIMFFKFVKSKKINNHLTFNRICCPSLESFTFLLPGRYHIKKYLNQDLSSDYERHWLLCYFEAPVLNLIILERVWIFKYFNMSLPIQLCY